MAPNPYKSRQAAKYKFVYPGKPLSTGKPGKFQVRVRTPLKPGQTKRDQFYIGSYASEEEGARAADKFMIEWMTNNPSSVPDFYKLLNFPLDAPDYLQDDNDVIHVDDLLRDLQQYYPGDESVNDILMGLEYLPDISLSCLDEIDPLVDTTTPGTSATVPLTSEDISAINDMIVGSTVPDILATSPPLAI